MYASFSTYIATRSVPYNTSTFTYTLHLRKRVSFLFPPFLLLNCFLFYVRDSVPTMCSFPSFSIFQTGAAFLVSLWQAVLADLLLVPSWDGPGSNHEFYLPQLCSDQVKEEGLISSAVPQIYCHCLNSTYCLTGCSTPEHVSDFPCLPGHFVLLCMTHCLCYGTACSSTLQIRNYNWKQSDSKRYKGVL